MVLGMLAVLLAGALPEATAGVDHLPRTQIDRSRGKLIPLPRKLAGDAGTHIDSRIRDDLIWIVKRFPEVYIGEGYSGPLPGGGWSGCHGCHAASSEHRIGLAVDIRPVDWDGRGCDRSWKQITRLAKLAEPRQGHTRGPFRWVGYDGDANHGCGNHLHLSWNHSTHYKEYRTSKWVEVFDLKR